MRLALLQSNARVGYKNAPAGTWSIVDKEPMSQLTPTLSKPTMMKVRAFLLDHQSAASFCGCYQFDGPRSAINMLSITINREQSHGVNSFNVAVIFFTSSTTR